MISQTTQLQKQSFGKIEALKLVGYLLKADARDWVLIALPDGTFKLGLGFFKDDKNG